MPAEHLGKPPSAASGLPCMHVSPAANGSTWCVAQDLASSVSMFKGFLLQVTNSCCACGACCARRERGYRRRAWMKVHSSSTRACQQMMRAGTPMKYLQSGAHEAPSTAAPALAPCSVRALCVAHRNAEALAGGAHQQAAAARLQKTDQR